MSCRLSPAMLDRVERREVAWCQLGQRNTARSSCEKLFGRWWSWPGAHRCDICQSVSEKLSYATLSATLRLSRVLRKKLYLSHPVASAHVRAEVKLKMDSWTLVVRPATRVRVGSFFGSSLSVMTSVRKQRNRKQESSAILERGCLFKRSLR